MHKPIEPSTTCFTSTKKITILGMLLIAGFNLMSHMAHASDGEEANKEAGKEANDQPQCLEVYPYLGFVVDNFAASATQSYFNQQESGDSKTRETWGFWFQYPLGRTDNLKGKNCDTPADSGEMPAIWLYGQTAHGVRSAEVDCTNSTDGFCSDSTTEKSLGILRNATSLESVLGLRWESTPFQNSNAVSYLKLQAGFVAVQDDIDDVAEISHVGVGWRIRSGQYRNSFIEIGVGKNDLFLERNTDRIKVNARLVKEGLLSGLFNIGGSKAKGFVHLSVDVDGHSGPDTIQTYLGLAY